MIAVQKWIEEKGLKSKLILQIHDELIMEVPEDEVDLVKENLPKIMDSVTELHVPLIAEVGVGDNWEAAHSQKTLGINRAFFDEGAKSA